MAQLVRPLFASRDVHTRMKLLKKKKITIYSLYPIDKGDCECVTMIKNYKDKLLLMSQKDREAEIEKTNYLVCPRDKSKMRRYKIICKNCDEVQGFCWATDATLKDFCDFHYVQWTDGNFWYGCLTPNISPIDQSLTLECTCGYDTRDFRANMTLPGRIATRIERENAKGREFATIKSKFNVVGA